MAPSKKQTAFYRNRAGVPFAFDSSVGVMPMPEGKDESTPLGTKLIKLLSGKLSPADLQSVIDLVSSPGANDEIYKPDIPEAEAKSFSNRFAPKAEDDQDVGIAKTPNVPGMDGKPRTFADRFPGAARIAVR